MTPNDVKIVADNIDDFIEVPDGVERLRKAVLTLAVSGKLAPQDKKEGTAQELFAQVLAESSKYTTGRKKKSSNLAPLSQDEIPFEIPTSWKWVRIREVTHDCGQKTPDKDFCYVDISSIDSSRGVIVEPKYLKPSEAPSRARKLVEDKSVIYSGVRPYLLNTAIVDLSALEKEVIVSTAFFVLKPYANISSEYIHLMVRSPYFDELSNKECVGAAYPAINDDKFEKLPVPLPPLQEQKRIVKRVKEVMKQLDELQVKKQERDEVRTRLARSAMQSLGKGESKIAFEHLTELVKTPSDIKELENALLTLAVSGELVPKIESTPWKTIRLGDVVELVTKGTTPKTYGHNFTTEGVPFLRAEDIKNRGIDVGAITHHISSETNNLLGRSKTKAGDVLLTIAGTIGRTAVVEESLPEMNMNQAIAVIRLKDSVSPHFLSTLFRSDLLQRQIRAGTVKMAIPNFSLTMIKNLEIPLPPLVEQKSIVKKVEEVMVLINRLRKVMEM